MFSVRYLVLAAASLAAASLAAPATQSHVKTRSLDLSDMINNTVCAIEVVIDENPDRIPQKIKMMKCAKQTDQWCLKNNITHDCCHDSHNKHIMECVQMTDTVVVFNKQTQETETLDVAVGCTCVIGSTTEAAPMPPP